MKRFLIAFLLAGVVQGQTISAIAHRPDLTPEQVELEHELLIDTYGTTTTWLTGRLNGSSMTDFSPEREDAVILSPCLKTDGVGDYVSFTPSTVNAGDTIEVYLNLLSNADGAGGRHRCIVRGAFDQYIAIFDNGDGRIIVRNSTIFTSGRRVLVSDGWVKVRLDIEETNSVLYVADIGEDYGVGEVTGINFSGVSFNEVCTDSSNPRFLNAEISYAKIGSTGPHYTFSEGSGLTAYDVSGNGNHGTIANVSGEVWDGVQTNSPYAAEYGCSKIGVFNGSNSEGDTGIKPNANITWSVVIRDNGSSTVDRFIGTNDGSDHRSYLQNSNGKWSAGYGDLFVESAESIDSNWHTLEFRSDKKVYLDNEEIINLSSATFSGDSTSSFKIGINDVTMSYSPFEICCLTVNGIYYDFSSAYINSLPNNGTLTNVDFLYLPALNNGTDDAAGLGITNPKGLAHNNGGYSLIFGGATNSYANLLTNSVNIVTNEAGLITELYEVTP